MRPHTVTHPGKSAESSCGLSRSIPSFITGACARVSRLTESFALFCLIGFLAFSLTPSGLEGAAVAARPNILLILADDLGYGDLSCQGSTAVNTPNLDRLARQGVRFTRCYSNSAECSPARTALLTGRYQQRVGGLECAIGVGNVGRYDEAIWLQQRGELGLPAQESELARALRAAGYATGIFGKWHLGYEEKFGPGAHGFDEAFITLGGGTDYVSHTEPDGKPQLRHNGRPVEAKGYLTDIFTDKALSWIAEQKNPWFVYLPYTAPHSPYQAPGDGPAPVPWAKGTPATYKAMIEHMDRRIGDLLAVIERRPDAANTIVVFTSDNGAVSPGSNGGLRGWKGQLWEGGMRVPGLMRWPARLRAGTTTDQVTLGMDLTATLLSAAGALDRVSRPLDGMDLLPVLMAGNGTTVPRTVYWRYKRGNNRRKAVLEGALKLVIENGKRSLHDLTKDTAEERDLSATRPDDAARLERMIETWERATAAPRLKDFSPPTP